MADAGQRPARPAPLGLLDLYLLRGVAGPFLMILAAVLVAMMLERALRLIHELSASGSDIVYFLPLLVQLIPYYLDLALPAAFMVALVLLVARLDERLELEVMLASGVSLARIAAPLIGFGLLVAAAGLVAGGWLEPLGRYGYRALRIEALNAGQVARLPPRAVHHPIDSLAVTFDRRRSDSGVDGIFVWQRLPDASELVMTSRTGRIGFSPQGQRFGIDLRDGRYFRQGRDGSTSLVRFDDLALRESLQLRDASWQRGWDQKELTLTELLAEIRNPSSRIPARALQSEYYSRIARSTTTPLLPLLVLALAFATKKGSRALGILLCGALLAVANHGMNLVQNLALAGAADPLAANLAGAGLIAALIVLIFLSARRLPSHGPIHSLLKRMNAALSRLTPLLPRLRTAGRRTIGSYVRWRLATWSLLALLAVVALLQMVDLFERTEDFVERNLGVAGILRYATLRLPLIVQQAIPIAALAGAMITFAGLARRREMTAIRAAGLSQWRILAMAAPVAILLALASAAMAEYLTPRTQLQFAAWWRAGEPTRSPAPPDGRWFRIADEIVRIGAASAGSTQLRDVRIFRRDHDGLLGERLGAESARFHSDRWTLERVERIGLGSGTIASERLERLAWRTPLQPGDVTALFSSPQALSSSAARRSLSAEAPLAQPETVLATRLNRSLAEPLAPLLMLLLALPLAFLSPRTSTAWPAWLYAAGGGLLYLVADGVLTVGAQVGYLAPAVGAWAAPLIVGLTGTTVLLYCER